MAHKYDLNFNGVTTQPLCFEPSKLDYELILSGLDTQLKTHQIDSKEYKYIEHLYSYISESYDELLEKIKKEEGETEDYGRQCMGCGNFISGGRICRECSGV